MVSELWQKEARGLCGAESVPRNLLARGVCVWWIMRRKFVKGVR